MVALCDSEAASLLNKPYSVRLRMFFIARVGGANTQPHCAQRTGLAQAAGVYFVLMQYACMYHYIYTHMFICLWDMFRDVDRIHTCTNTTWYMSIMAGRDTELIRFLKSAA